MKRGDHIFANGLLQTINAVSARVSLELGSLREAKILDEMFTSCRSILEQSPYQLFKFAMISYMTALKTRHDRPVNRSNVEETHFAIRDALASLAFKPDCLFRDKNSLTPPKARAEGLFGPVAESQRFPA